MAEQQAQIIDIAAQRAVRDARAGREGPAGRPRCSAVTASGAPCRNYAVDEGRCRVHAVRGGPTGSEDATTADTAADRRVPVERTGLAGHTGLAARTGRSEQPGRTEQPGGAEQPVRAGWSGGPTGPRSSGAAPAGQPRDDAFERADRELGRRGFAPAVDALEALRDAADESWIGHLREAAAFLGRRLTGDYPVDDFGFDQDLTEHVLMPLVRPLHRRYWRVASHGIEHVPRDSGALLVANHAGTLPFDAMITRVDLFDRTGRHARELGADLVFRTPIIGEFARKTGVTLAAGDDADRLLAAGELVAVWPEGYKGLGKPWKERYRLKRFGRGGFVATALRAQVPIVPTAIVGSEEIYPLLFDLRVVAKLLGLPYFPVVAQMLALPVLGPFALLPLPSKWVIEYGVPIDTGPFGPEAADDPMVVFDLTDQVRDRIQRMLNRNLMGRRSLFL